MNELISHARVFVVVMAVLIGAGSASAMDFTWTGASAERDANGAKKWDDAANWNCTDSDRTRFPYPQGANGQEISVVFQAGIGEETIALPLASANMDLADKLTMVDGSITFVRPAGATDSYAYCIACNAGSNVDDFGAAEVTLDGVFLSVSRPGAALFPMTMGTGRLNLVNGATFEAGDFIHGSGGTIRVADGSLLRVTDSNNNGGGIHIGGTSVIEIDNATVQIDGACNFGDKSAGGRMIFRGAHPRLFLNKKDRQCKASADGAEFVFEIPDGGYTMTDALGHEQIWVPITSHADKTTGQFPNNKAISFSVDPDSPVFESEFDATIPLVGWAGTTGLSSPSKFLITPVETVCTVDGATCAWTVSTAAGSCTATTNAAAAEEYVWTDYTNLNLSATSPVYYSLGVRIHGAGDDVPVKPAIRSISAVGDTDGTVVVSFAATHATAGTTAKVSVSTDGGVSWSERAGEIVNGTVTVSFDPFSFGEYDFRLMLTNEAGSDEASGTFPVTDTAVYTWQAAGGMLDGSWTNRAHWSADRAVRADYPGAVGASAVASFSGLGSVTVTVENAAAELKDLVLGGGTVLRLRGAENALTLDRLTPSSKAASTLLFEIPVTGYANAPIAGSANAARLCGNDEGLRLLVDRASPYLERHLSVWREQPLVDWPTGINTAPLSPDAGDADETEALSAKVRVKPAAFDSRTDPKRLSVEVRGFVPTVVALGKATNEDGPGGGEEDDPGSWTDDPTVDEELVWSEASETAEKKYNTCVILATSDDTAAGLWRTRLNDAGVAVARVRGDFTGDMAGAAGQRAVRVARAAANSGRHGLSANAKIGAVGIGEGARLALLMALSSKDTFYTPNDSTDTLSSKLDFAGVVSPCDCIDGGVTNIVLNDKDEPTVNGEYANLAPEFKFDGNKCPIATISGDREFDDPTTTYWTASVIYRRIRERTGSGRGWMNHLVTQAHFYGSEENSGNRVKRMLEFMKSAGALGSMGTKTSASSLYPGGDRDPIYHDPAKYEKTYLWDVENGISPIDPETNKPYPFTDSTKIPYIEWYVPANLTTRAIQIIYSGGSYGTSQPGSSEVKPARICLNMHGMTVVTLHYRATGGGENGYTRSQQDLQRAIRMVRAKAPSLGLDPNRIGIMGSSAGGHMTLYHATKSLTSAYGRLDAIDDYPATVQWAIPVYPAYIVGGGAYDGESEKGLDPIRANNKFLYDEATPAILFMHGDEDLWTAGGSVKVWEALHRHGFETELHTFAELSHCFQDNIYPGTSGYHYMDIVWEFLTSHGFNVW